MNENNKSYFFIETQFDNLGDALLNRELIKLAAEYSTVTVGTSKVPHTFLDMIDKSFLNSAIEDEKSSREFFLIKIIFQRLLGRKCFLFLSPGGWIGEIDGNLNLRSWLHAFLYLFMSKIGVAIIQVGVSYEDIGPKLLKLIRFRAKSFRFHLVRDENSFFYLKAKNIDTNGLCPDFAFNLFESIEDIKPDHRITFSFRSDQHSEQIADIQDCIKFIIENKKPSYIQFVSQVTKDDQVNRYLAEWVRQQYGFEVVFHQLKSIQFAQKCYSETGLIVSNRLHALLIAASAGNAMIAAPIDNRNEKIISLFQDIGLSDFVLKTGQDWDAKLYQELEGKLNNYIFNPLSYKDKLKKQFTQFFQGSPFNVK